MRKKNKEQDSNLPIAYNSLIENAGFKEWLGYVQKAFPNTSEELHLQYTGCLLGEMAKRLSMGQTLSFTYIHPLTGKVKLSKISLKIIDENFNTLK